MMPNPLNKIEDCKFLTSEIDLYFCPPYGVRKQLQLHTPATRLDYALDPGHLRK